MRHRSRYNGGSAANTLPGFSYVGCSLAVKQGNFLCAQLRSATFKKKHCVEPNAALSLLHVQGCSTL